MASFQDRWDEVRSRSPSAYIDAFANIFLEDDWMRFFDEQHEQQQEMDEEEAEPYQLTLDVASSRRDLLVRLRAL